MLLKIDVKKEDIIQNKNGRIIVKLHYYSAFAIGAHLAVTDGNTVKDFDSNKPKSWKNIFIGGKGGIAVG